MSGNPILRTLAVAASGALLVSALAVPATARDRAIDCKDGGWRDLKTADGRSFKNQGQCVAHVVQGRVVRGATLVIAYSDIDGQDGYSTGDVLISKLVDTSGDGQPGPGDTIIMGRYPLDFAASAFGDWTTTRHTVSTVMGATDTVLGVTTTTGGAHEWVRLGSAVVGTSPSGAEAYFEYPNAAGNPETGFQDQVWGATTAERLVTAAGSPSGPTTEVNLHSDGDFTDDPFIDVIFDF